MAVTRTVFIDTTLSNYQSLATQYGADTFNVVLLNGASPHADQIQSWLTSHNTSAADINIVSASASVNGAFTPRVVFVDSSVANVNTVIAGVPANATVVVLDASRDGVQQIRDYLAANAGKVGAIDIVTDLASVDVVSHGGPGEIMLGSTVLNSSNLANYSNQLADIGSHLTAGADLLLYGCDVASGTTGQQFISALATATGADVAASTDLTGSAAAGGNWVLESNTGTIETAALNIAGYDGVLLANAITSITMQDDEDTGPGISTHLQVQTIRGTFTTNNNILPTIWVSTGGSTSTRTPITIQQADFDATNKIGTFSVSVTLKEGANSIQFWTNDTAQSSISNFSYKYTPDITPPAQPVITSINGNSVSANIQTNDTTPTLTITAEADTKVEVFKGGVSVGTATQTAAHSGIYTFTSGILNEGSYSFTAKATDAAGNTSIVSNPQSIAIDLTAPGTPAITGFNGNSVSANIQTNDTTPTLTITAEADSTVEVFKGGVSVGTAAQTAPHSGIYTFTSGILNEGSYSFTAKATDAAGNTSIVSNPQSIAIDLTAPGTPAITGFNGNGVSANIQTNDTTPTLTITAEADSTVEVFKGGVSVGTATQTAPHSGIYTFTSGILNEGSYSFTAKATDAAGNTSIVSNPQSIAIDLTAPGTPAITGFNGNGVSANIQTNDTTPTLTITAEADSTVEVFKGGVSVGTATQTAAHSGIYTFTSGILNEGSYSFTAKATDAAGNTSIVSNPQSIAIDLTAPGTPAITGFNGNSVSANIQTNDTTPTLTITAEADSTVEVFKGGVSVGTAAQTAPHSGIYTFTSGILNEGSYSFTAKATDAAGNTSIVSNPQSIAIDLTAPGTPAITGFNGNGVSANIQTNDTTPTLTITAEADSTVEVFKGGVSVGTATQTAPHSGIYTFTSGILNEGSYSFTAKATDAAGNTSIVSNPQSIAIDLTAPGTPAITGFNGNGVSANIQTNDTTPTLTITAEADSTVEVFKGGVSVGTATQTAAHSGIYTFTSGILNEGSYSFTATATDAAGNTSTASSAQAITIDATPPAAPSITAFSDNSGSSGDNLTNDTTPTLTISAEADTTVKVYQGNVEVGTATQTAPHSGIYTFTSATLNDGSYSFTATATDAAGNTSTASSAQAITIDATPPAAPSITAFSDNSGSSGDNLTNDTTPTLTISAEADTTVKVYQGNVEVGTATQTTPHSGIYTFTSATLNDGSYSFTATVTDAAGNTSTASAEKTIAIDATPPAAPSITAFSDNSGSSGDNLTNDTTPTLTISAEADTTVKVYQGNVEVGTATQTAPHSGIYTFTSATLNDGSYSFTATATDAAGNTSTVSAEKAITIDATPPAAPSITAFSDNSGSSGDNLTNDTTPTLTISAEADTTVEVFKGGMSVGTATQTAPHSGIYTFTSATLNDGSYSFTATATDAAGNTSTVSSAQAITIDATPPAAPSITAFSDNSGSSGDNLTNDTTPTLTISAEADTTVKVYQGDSLVGTATQTAPHSGIYTFTSATLNDGSYSFTATATDAAGNTSTVSSAQAITIDATPPAAPSITAFSDNSGSSGDNLTNDTTPTLTISAEADTTVKVYQGNVEVGTATQTAPHSGIYTFTSATLNDGSYSFTATATDAAGNTSTASAEKTIAIDATPPAAPSITAFSDNSGSSGDNLTNDTTPTLTISAEADTTVKVYQGNVEVGTATQTAPHSGIYTFTSATLNDGSYSFTATATDAAGNTSTASAEKAITIDATPPAAPSITAFSDNSGSSGDNLTNDTTPTLTISAEADTTVKVYQGNVEVGTATQTAPHSGIYTFTSATLNDGSYSFTATATDAAGNTSTASAEKTIAIDGTPPAAPSITAFSDNSGSSGDNLTNDTTPTLTISAEADTTVKVYQGDVEVGTATQTAPHSGIYTFTSATLNDGSYSFTATATDAAGNTSTVSSAQAITIDATPPAAPSITAFSDNSGSSGDNLTNDTTPTLTISAEADTTVKVYQGNVEVGTATQTAPHSGIYTFTSATLNDGSYSFTATATDAAGNTSTASAEKTIAIDGTPPAAPSITAFSDNSGSSGDNLTNDTTPTLTISAEADTTVKVYQGDVEVGTATQTAPHSGIYTFTSATLNDGSYSFTATATDAAGNTSTVSAEKTIAIDATPPAAPSITAFSDNSGSSGDNLTNDTTPTLTISAEADTTVKVYQGDSLVGTATQTAPHSGIYTFTSATLGDGSYSFTATATDAAGNTSTASSAQAITIDATPPAAPSITAFSDNSGSSGDNLTNDTTPTLTISAEADTTVKVYQGNVEVGTAIQTAPHSGIYTFTSATLNDGSYSFTATATDAAGNTSTVSAEKTIAIDATPPAAPSITAFSDNSGSSGDNLTNDTTPTLTISAEADTTVKVYQGDSLVGTATQTAPHSGIYTFTSATLNDGSYSFTATATDAAGNTSTVSSAQAITIDATPPAAPSITAFSDNSGSSGDNLTNDTTPTLTISAEADTTVKVYQGNVEVGTATQTAPHSGIYTFTSATLNDGSYSFTATATDAAGNTSTASAEKTIAIDATPPAAPSITAFSDNSGSSGDNLTNDTTPTLTISAEADTTVKVYQGNVEVGTATQTAPHSGIYTFTSATLNDGSYSFTATATDAAGNTSTVSAEKAITIDATPPAAPSITAFSDNSGSSGDNLTNDTTPTLTISAEADTTVKVYQGNVEVGTAIQTAPHSGIYTFTSATLGDGSYSFTAKATDAAGNTSTASAEKAITIDATAPIPSVKLTNDSGDNTDLLTNDARLVLNTLESGATRMFEVDGNKLSNYDAGSLSQGQHVITVTDTDAAGNAGSASFSFTLDSNGPVFSSAASVSKPENIGEGQVVYKAVAADNHGVTYSLTDTDTTKFQIGADGSVTLMENPNFEAKNAYAFTVRATDAAGNHTDKAVVLNITDVNEAPVAPSISSSTCENVPIAIHVGDLVSDPDAASTLTVSLNTSTATLRWDNTDINTSTTIINPFTKLAVDLSTLSVKASVAADGTVTLTPPAELDWMMTGQTLNATFSYTVSDGTLSSSASISLVINGSTNDKGVNLSGGNGDDSLSGNTTNNAEDVLMGGNGNDTLNGYGGTDALYGGNGNDKLYGGAGIDYLYGDSGDDTIYGGTEGDYIFGGKGNDILWGEAGADKFVFAPQGGNDRVMDFKAGEGDMLYFADFFTTAPTVDAFLSKYVTDTGNDLLINLQGTTIVLVGVANVSDLKGHIGFGIPA